MSRSNAWFLGVGFCLLFASGSIVAQQAPDDEPEPAPVAPAEAPPNPMDLERVMPPPEQGSFDLELRYLNQLPAEQFVRLQANGVEFATLWRNQETGNPQGALLIVHDNGHHQDWPHVVRDLRQYLPVVGWSTLSIAMPPVPAPRVPARLLDNDDIVPGSAAGFEPDEDYLPMVDARIEASINELIRRGYLNIALVGVGSGAYQVTRFITTNAPEGDGFGFGLIMLDARPQDTAALAALLAQLDVPVLDLYLNRSAHSAQAAQQRRAALNRAGQGNNLVQVREQSSSTNYRASPNVVTRRVWGWLRSNMSGREADIINSGNGGGG
ncbi:alpha/beta hydrolase family protein [Salinispirillum sp. LH 10-3-1]|uniref:Alpha/beta hydrolase family protein n=1 Tax=Salinispirillum sp. LH 10-3-1 TaxID=2952525 RepID=A0AB38YIF2_9GAMM